MTGTEIFQRTAAYEREAKSIRLLAPQWRLLLAFDGTGNLGEIAWKADLSLLEALPLADKFVLRNWIEEMPITLEQYLERAGATEAPTPVPVSVSVVAQVEPEPTPPMEPISIPSIVYVSNSEYDSVMPMAPLPEPVVIVPEVLVTPVAPPSAPISHTPPALPLRPRLPHGPMRLNAVVDYVTSLVGNTALGQLLVYRVFLRVSPELLQAEGISSIHLANETSLIRSKELQQAISQAVQEVARRPLPEGVYAPS